MQRTMEWENPTTYKDGTAIGAEKSTLLVHIWKDGVEVYETLPNVTTFPIEVTPGVTNSWQLQAEVGGMKSELSLPFSYTEPFQVPSPPAKIKVS